MLKVMIVDDEMLVRLGIKSLIAWEENGFIYAGDASDGLKALELIQADQPDIILLDIIMPYMNGIELLGSIKQTFPHIRVVMLSSHNDYNYMREAIRIGADDYLLKSSLKPEELLACLQEVGRKVVGEQDIKKSQFSQSSPRSRLLEAIREEKSDTELSRITVETGWKEQDHVLFLILLHRKEHMLYADNSVYATTMNLVEQTAMKWVDEARVLEYKQNEILVVFPHMNKEDMEQMGKDIIVSSMRFLSVPVSIGMSMAFTSLEGIRKAYGEANEAIQRFFYAGSGQIYPYSPNESEGSKEQPGQLSEFSTKPLQQMVYTSDIDLIVKELDTLFEQLERSRLPRAPCNLLLLELLGCFQAGLKELQLDISAYTGQGQAIYEQIFTFSSLEEARHWFEQLAEWFCREARGEKEHRYSKEIIQLLAYLTEHYNEPVSLKYAANYVHLSEGYLGYLFKKETGKNFVEYISDLRMHKAQEYLRNTDMPGYLIAERIGYPNFNYFGRIFKKKLGLSPNQYREQIRSNR